MFVFEIAFSHPFRVFCKSQVLMFLAERLVSDEFENGKDLYSTGY